MTADKVIKVFRQARNSGQCRGESCFYRLQLIYVCRVNHHVFILIHFTNVFV